MLQQYRSGRHAMRVAAGALILATAVACGDKPKKVASSQPQPPASMPTSMPTVSATPSPLGRSTPTGISIPKLRIDSPIMKLGLNSDHTVQVPPLSRPQMTGWYQGGPTPGQKGPAVILGHNVAGGGRAVFARLGTLRPGDRVEVTRADRSVAVFEITKLEQIPKAKFPTMKVYGKLPYPAIRLITCGGRFDSSWGHHVDNVIAYGTMVSSR